MDRHFVGRISFPHPLAESPGPSVLFENALSDEKRDAFRELKKQFRGLEYRCTNVKCREPVDIGLFNCNLCHEPLEIKVDVIEENGQQKIVPSTARAWCSGGHKHTYGKKFFGRCPHDGAELEYCLIGNEKTEFALWMCLAISAPKIGNTTSYYNAFLSLGNAGKALDILVHAGMLEKKQLDVILGNYCKEPYYFVITEKGIEKRNEYANTLKKHNLLTDFRIFLPKRREELEAIPESLGDRHKRYAFALNNTLAKDIPEEIRNSLLVELKYKRGFKKHLVDYINNDLLYQDEIKWLEERWVNSIPGIRVEKIGIVYTFKITPRRKTSEKILVEHIPTSYHKEIFQLDKSKIDWNKYEQTK